MSLYLYRKTEAPTPSRRAPELYLSAKKIRASFISTFSERTLRSKNNEYATVTRNTKLMVVQVNLYNRTSVRLPGPNVVVSHARNGYRTQYQ